MRTVHAAVLTVLCGASFGLGVFATQGPSPVVSALKGSPKAHSEWREDLSALRGTAEGEALRSVALQSVQDAPNTFALTEGVTLLGWVGDERDVGLLVALLHDEDVDSACIESLGRLGAVDELLELTEHSQHRVGALVGLGLTGSEEALPVLVDALDDPTRRDVAAHGLALHGSEAAQVALVEAWPESDNWFVGAVAGALASFPEDSPGRAALRVHVTSGDGVHRNAAMDALAQVDDPQLFDALLVAVKSGSPAQRAAALSALGTLDDPRGVPVLVEIADTGRRTEIWPAIWALDSISDDRAEEALRVLVREGSEEVSGYAAGALDPELHSESVETLFWAIDNRGTNARGAARDALFAAPWRELPEEVLDLAFEEIENPKVGNRWSGNAWTVVLRYGGEPAQKRVAELLLETDNANRAEALWALQGQPHLLPDSLALQLLGDESPDVRRAALGLLEARGGDDDGMLEKALIARLGDEDRMGWDGLEDTLARIGGPDGVDALLKQVHAGTANQSSMALSALVNAGDPAHMDKLRRLYEKSDDDELRRRVLDSVLWSGGGLSEDFALSALKNEDDPYIRSSAASALGNSGTPEAVETLEGLLQDDDPTVRSAALGALAGQPGMQKRLIDSLDDPDLAHTAMASLQNDPSPAARAAVKGVVLDDDADLSLRTSAIYAMGWNNGDPDVLGQVLGDEDSSVRAAALSALESRGNTESAEHIATMLDDPDLGVQAAYGLQRIGGRVYEENAERIDELVGAQANLGLGNLGYYDDWTGGLHDLGYLEADITVGEHDYEELITIDEYEEEYDEYEDEFEYNEEDYDDWEDTGYPFEDDEDLDEGVYEEDLW
jgi:HEAT repeat protein